jgi:hypothetical protein
MFDHLDFRRPLLICDIPRLDFSCGYAISLELSFLMFSLDIYLCHFHIVVYTSKYPT